MHIRTTFYILFSIFLLNSCGTVEKVKSDALPIAHDDWDILLKKHVSEAGNVDYKGFLEDKALFEDYIQKLSKHHPNDKNWPKADQLAYWINAYNAFTLKLILDKYPVSSIKDLKSGIPFVNTVWDIKFINIENSIYDLNNIEHGIIRKQFKDPRIHFAVNCASYSCPRLRAEAFTASRLEEQLEDQAKYFVNNIRKNIIGENEVNLSKLFLWYAGDFKQDGKDVVDFINQYSNINISKNANVKYLDYIWTLNE